MFKNVHVHRVKHLAPIWFQDPLKFETKSIRLRLDERIWGRNFKFIIINLSNSFGVEEFVDGFEIHTSIFSYILRHCDGFQMTHNMGHLKSFLQIPTSKQIPQFKHNLKVNQENIANIQYLHNIHKYI